MSLKLSLGAIQYYWPKQTVFAWYDRIADTDADIIYLGETVCARRHELRLADWLAIADNLRRQRSPARQPDPTRKR